MNYTIKELVRSFDWSDFQQNRSTYKKEVINGRNYYKEGTTTATSVVGNLYRIEASEEQFNYVLLIGVARQHPNDVKINYNEGIEQAAINAQINPVATIKFQDKITWETFKSIANAYSNSVKTEFVKTLKELKANGDVPANFNRGNVINKVYYNNYYKEFREKFPHIVNKRQCA